MPETSAGETVYADPDELVAYVQTQPKSLGLSSNKDEDGDGVSDWQEHLEALQPKAKARIDTFCRRDFEDHPNDTVTTDGGNSILDVPGPVREIAAVRVDDDEVYAEEYGAREYGGVIKKAGTWPSGVGNVEVDLSWGYETPPADVAEAEMKLVDHTVVGQAQKREGMVEQADSFELTVNIPVSMNSEIRSMLKPYREMGVFN